MSEALSYDAVPRLVDMLLREQQDLSAVERFSQRHADISEPLQARFYRDLLPSAAPGAGEQYAFQVDLAACTGCKSCVAACHSLNGLDEHEAWRKVGVIEGEVAGQRVMHTVTTACHHCEDPGCMRGCPVQAYEKDEQTGIVRHLDDQCIGCQYCLMTCPYEVPQFDEARGIVRKCDMCSGRIEAGEAPACVQACPTEAISIEIVPRNDPAASARELLPVPAGALPASSLTRPTTRYLNAAAAATAFDANIGPLRAGAPHTPLAVMLVGVQLSLGLACAAWLSGRFAPTGFAPLDGWAWLVAAATALAAQAAALAHLGRPVYAFRAVLGWRTSWMSREILALGAYAGLVVLAAIAANATWLAPLLGGVVGHAIAGLARLAPLAGLAALGAGFAGLACSIMIYVATGRPLWALQRTAGRFASSVAVLGGVGAGWLGLAVFASGVGSPELELDATARVALAASLCGGLAALGIKLLAEAAQSRRIDATPGDALGRSALLLDGVLSALVGIRKRSAHWGAGALAIVAAGLALGVESTIAVRALAALATLGFAGVLLSEFSERRLFFKAEAAPAMPGLG